MHELPSGGGEADYELFLGRELVGVTVPTRPLPFRYESTGAKTLSPMGSKRIRRRGGGSWPGRSG